MKTPPTFTVKANGHLITTGIKGTQVPGTILSIFDRDLKYLSVDNIREKIVEIEDMCAVAGIKHTRFFKSIWKIVEGNNREEIVTGLYNAILSAEGLSLLPGFGYAERCGETIRKINVNAEKVSILKVGSN